LVSTRKQDTPLSILSGCIAGRIAGRIAKDVLHMAMSLACLLLEEILLGWKIFVAQVCPEGAAILRRA
jgi:hypothetical protein